MSFGPSFARPVEICQSAWERVVAPMQLPSTLDEKLRDEWVTAHRAGDPRAEVRALVAGLEGVHWRWPWFDECATIFAHDAAWPHNWRRDGTVLPGFWKAPRFRCEILAITLYATRAAIDRAPGLAEIAARRGGYRLSVVLGCPVEAAVAARHAGAIEAGDLSIVPPFFPGDRTTLTAKRKP